MSYRVWGEVPLHSPRPVVLWLGTRTPEPTVPGGLIPEGAEPTLVLTLPFDTAELSRANVSALHDLLGGWLRGELES